MNRSTALKFAASLLRDSGEKGSTDNALLLEQMADEQRDLLLDSCGICDGRGAIVYNDGTIRKCLVCNGTGWAR